MQSSRSFVSQYSFVITLLTLLGVTAARADDDSLNQKVEHGAEQTKVAVEHGAETTKIAVVHGAEKTQEVLTKAAESTDHALHTAADKTAQALHKAGDAIESTVGSGSK